jgi:hypothetical protein
VARECSWVTPHLSYQSTHELHQGSLGSGTTDARCVGTASAHAQRNRPCRRKHPCSPLLLDRLPGSVRQPTAPTAGALPAPLAVVTVSVPVPVITHLVLSPVMLTMTMGRGAREVAAARVAAAPAAHALDADPFDRPATGCPAGGGTELLQCTVCDRLFTTVYRYSRHA